ncbi:MAG: hypothetical protein OHK0039_46420 [Bacteroidia bacterium]
MLNLRILFYLIGFWRNRAVRRSETGLRRLQARRWRRLLRVLRRSPHYRDLAQPGARPTDFPVIDKAGFMAAFDEINTAGITRAAALEVALAAEESRDFSPQIDGITIGLSSGTTGNKGIFLASTDERARWVAAVLDRVIGFSLRRRRVAFFLRANSNLYESARSRLLVFRFFDLFRPMPDLLGELGAFQPHILVAQPAVLREITRAIEAGTLRITPQRVISVAEVLEPQDREAFGQVFGQPIHEVYQCTEGFLAATCPAGRLHFNEDFLLIEPHYLDAEQTRYHPVITDLMRHTQPVVRYRLDDVILAASEPCPCGNPARSIGRIEGRADDVLRLRGKTGDEIVIYPDFIRRAMITASDDIVFYAVTQTGAATLAGYIEVRPGADAAEAKARAEQQVRHVLDRLGAAPCTWVWETTFEHHPTFKLRRIRNAYHSSHQAAGHG